MGNISDTTSTDVSESGSCMEVHRDEEWMSNYEEMEEEEMGDRVMINQEEDITNRYCQMITTRPDWTTDHLTGMTKSLLSCERSVKIGGTGPATTPLNTNCGKDDTGTAEGHIHRTKEGDYKHSAQIMQCHRQHLVSALSCGENANPFY